MGIGANVLIVGSPTGEDRSELLESTGYRCDTSPGGTDLEGVVEAGNPAVILVSAASRDGLDTIRMLKHGRASRRIPVAAIDLGSDTESLRACYEAGADDAFEANAPETEMLARLVPLVRLSGMEAELQRRAETSAEFGVSVDTEVEPPPPAAQFQLLVVGIERDAFEALCPLLSKSGISYVAEPDPYRARSRLEGNGDGFVGALVYMTGGAARDKCLYFCRSVRHDRRFFDLPLFVVADEAAIRDPAAAYGQGASVFAHLPVDCDFIDVHLRILYRGRALRREFGKRLATALVNSTADDLRSVYSTEFTRAHLQRLERDVVESARHSSAILFFIPTIGEVAALYGDDSAMQLRQQMADWLSGLVRIEDLVGRAGPDEFLMLLPRTSLDEAERVRRRVAGVLHQSEFRLADNVPVGVEVLIQSALTMVEPGDTMDRLIGRASTDLA